MHIRRITPTIGIEITDLDLAQPISDIGLAAVKQAWLGGKVAVFPGQKLGEKDLTRFGERFGELEIHVRSTYHSRENKEVMIVSNLKEDGRAIGVLCDGEAQWHIDQSYMPQPTWGTILFGDTIPTEGGDTWFADLAAAYDRMPAALKATLADKRIVNSVDRHNRRKAASRPDLQMSAEQLKRAPDSPHPAVRTHPVFGSEAIWYSPSHGAEIEGSTEDASQPIFQELLAYMTQEDLIYKHRWSPGDVVMWDNSSVMHRRDPFASHYTRLLKRVSFRYPPEHRVPV
jgi:alpha-ketoglutarate-dependent taurine dioxygenase